MSTTTNTTISPAQHQANINNAQKSTGPRTEEGKAKARYNARRHGLTGQFYVMDEDDRIAYNHHENEMLAVLNPADYYERQLAIAIAQDHWRLHRVKGIEFNSYGIGHADYAPETDADTPETETAVTTARTWQTNDRAFSNMALYETRLHRILTKNKRELDALQAQRKAAEAQAQEEAELLLSRRLMNAEKPHPTETIEVNGFVFSNATILRTLTRKQELAEARWYKARNWDRTKQPQFNVFNFPKAA